MEIMCCTSLRGAAFFGASVHIAVGLLLFSRYVVATLVFTFYNFNDLFSEKVTTFVAPFMIYVTLLLALGLLIFHSVEKECFFLLKWSSVAFSLLQLAVFLTILLLKFSPSYQYHQFPFLPESLTSGHFPSATWSPTGGGYFPPSGPSILTVPHGAVLVEQPLSKSPSSDPPDPGGTFGDLPWRPGLLREIQRLAILISSVLLTLVYLFFLFLYVRQLNYEDTGHVYGHAQAITRNIAFYVQPQFTAPPQGQPHHHHHHHQQQQQATQDNNKLSQVQRSQTQIPSQFLPQEGHPSSSLPKKCSLTKPLATTTATPPAPGALPSLSGSSLGGDQRSPKRIQRHQDGGQKVEFAVNMTDFNAQRSAATPHGGGTRETHITSGVAHTGPSIGGVGVAPIGPSLGGVGSPTPHRSPIPAQVRINFYPKDLIREFQGDDPPSIDRGGDFLQESDHHRPHLPLQGPPPPSRAPPPPPLIPNLPPPPLPPRQHQPYQTTHHHPPPNLPPPHQHHHQFQQGPHQHLPPGEPLPHHLHHQGPRLPHHQTPLPHHYPPGHQSVQFKRELVHHNLYPNQSDSLSPVSSVGYSPNPRGGLKGHHMVSMV